MNTLLACSLACLPILLYKPLHPIIRSFFIHKVHTLLFFIPGVVIPESTMRPLIPSTIFMYHRPLEHLVHIDKVLAFHLLPQV
jgi:hypothetical protein